ncbi:MAG TPA: hypothetical protein VGI46_18195 [Candidatus Acidoferrum sp.]|jgi:hypothetical protein
MLKRPCAFLSAALFTAVPLFAQDSPSKKPKDCAGVISADGESFACDKDHHVWKVSNPAVLQGMEGHHAKLTFRPSSGDEVLVLSASSIQEHTVSPGDSAFRR